MVLKIIVEKKKHSIVNKESIHHISENKSLKKLSVIVKSESDTN